MRENPTLPAIRLIQRRPNDPDPPFPAPAAMHITLRQLQVFLAVHEARNLSRAAARLCVTASAASQSLRELERALDAELFTRTAAGLAPTPAGASLVPQATLVVKKAQEIETLFAAQKAGLAGRLAVGANRASGIYILSRRLPAFKTRHPGVDPVLIIEDNDVVERGVLENRFDVGFVSRPPLDAALESFACFRDDFVIVASPSSPLIAMDASAEDFSMATWIMDQEKNVREAALRWLQDQGITVSRMLLMNTMGALKRAAATGPGVAVLPYLSVREEILRGDLVELRKDVNPDRTAESARRIYAIYRPEHGRPLRELFFRECGIRPLDAGCAP